MSLLRIRPALNRSSPVASIAMDPMTSVMVGLPVMGSVAVAAPAEPTTLFPDMGVALLVGGIYTGNLQLSSHRHNREIGWWDLLTVVGRLCIVAHVSKSPVKHWSHRDTALPY